MYSNLIDKARNLLVTIHFRSSDRTLAGKIIEIDDVFVEVIVKVNKAAGDFAKTPAEYESCGEKCAEDRILVAINDISIIA